MKENEKIVFNGYREIVEDFWGFKDETEIIAEAKEKAKNWWTEKVLFLDELAYGHDLYGRIEWVNEEETFVEIGKKSFKVLLLAGDGGFRSMLFRAEDYSDIIAEDNTLEFIPNPW